MRHPSFLGIIIIYEKYKPEIIQNNKKAAGIAQDKMCWQCTQYYVKCLKYGHVNFT